MSMKGDFINRKLKQIGTINLFGKEINIGTLGQLPSDFYLNVKAMEREGRANVKSHPVLATLNGHKASLSIGTTQYFLLKTTTPYRDQTNVLMQESQTFQTIEADVKLDITPYVGESGLITLEIKPDFRTPVGRDLLGSPPDNRQTGSEFDTHRQGRRDRGAGRLGAGDRLGSEDQGADSGVDSAAGKSVLLHDQRQAEVGTHDLRHAADLVRRSLPERLRPAWGGRVALEPVVPLAKACLVTAIGQGQRRSLHEYSLSMPPRLG